MRFVKAHIRSLHITTPIFYANAIPHIGHAYTMVLADVIKRSQKMLNPEFPVTLSTGTDEHGMKVAKAALKAGMVPEEFCNQISKQYKEIARSLSIDYDVFVRTTHKNHVENVTNIWVRQKRKESTQSVE